MAPEVVSITLSDRGNVRKARPVFQLTSPLRVAPDSRLAWRVVNLVGSERPRLPAADGTRFAPWVPLMKIDGPPEPVLQQCKDVIDTVEAPGQRANLLGVTRILAELRFDEKMLDRLLKVEGKMIESPADEVV